MKIASANGVLGEKVQIDSIFNSLVNDQGTGKSNKIILKTTKINERTLLIFVI